MERAWQDHGSDDPVAISTHNENGPAISLLESDGFGQTGSLQKDGVEHVVFQRDP